jgi:hypothetical protein
VLPIIIAILIIENSSSSNIIELIVCSSVKLH